MGFNIYKPAGSAGGGESHAPVTVTDSSTVDFMLTDQQISAAVKISADADNAAEARGDGLYVTSGGSTTSLLIDLHAGAGVTMDGSNNVSAWASQSESYVAVQDPALATSTQPLYVASVINGQPVIRFDGSNDALLIRLQATQVNQLTIGIVIRPIATEAGEAIFQWSNTYTSSAPFVLFQRNGTDVRWFVDGNYRSTNANATSTARIYILVWNGFTWRVYQDGTLATTYHGATGGVANIANGTGLFFGGGFGGYANVDIAAFRLYNTALSDTDRDALEATWGTTYGITVS